MWNPGIVRELNICDERKVSTTLRIGPKLASLQRWLWVVIPASAFIVTTKETSQENLRVWKITSVEFRYLGQTVA